MLQRPVPLLLSLVLGVSMWVGTSITDSTGSHCASIVPLGSSELLIRTVDPGIASGRVEVLNLDCHGELVARWPNQVAIPAGVELTVVARWRARRALLGRPDGTLVVSQVGEQHGTPSLLARSRNSVAKTAHKYFGEQAALVDALLAGRKGAIDRDLRDAFAASGIIHLLAISGFHVGLMAAWLIYLLRLLGVSRNKSRLIAAAATLGYAAWLGWPPAATRAAAMLSIYTYTRHRQRSVRPDALIGASAVVILLLDPWAVSRIGAWLSLSAISGVIWLTRWVKRQPQLSSYHKMRDALSASVGATLTTAPITALIFGQVAVIAPLVNLLAVPLVAAILPALFVTVLLEPISPLIASGFAASAAKLLQLLEALANWAQHLPGAATVPNPGIGGALPWLLVLGVMLWATNGRARFPETVRRVGWASACGIWFTLTVGLNDFSGLKGRLTLHFLDVGQGDAVAIGTPRGNWLLVDAGPGDQRWDAGERVVVPWLRRVGADRVQVLIASHAHRDHVGGAEAVLRALPVAVLLEPAQPYWEDGYRRMLQATAETNTQWRQAVAGDCWQIDGVTFTIVHPEPGWQREGDDLNEDSLVLLVRWGGFSALLPGDAGIIAEAEFVAEVGEVDLLKVGHHGSRTATGTELLEQVSPRAAVVSSGRNFYGHPSSEALSRLREFDIPLWRTDREGSVTVSTDGESFTVTGGRTVATFDAGQPNHEESTCSMPLR